MRWARPACLPPSSIPRASATSPGPRASSPRPMPSTRPSSPASHATCVPSPMAPPTQAERELGELVARRRQLVVMHTGETNRLEQVACASTRKSLRAVLRLLDRQIKAVDAQLESLIAASPAWRAKADLLRTVPGIGPRREQDAGRRTPRVGQAQPQADRGRWSAWRRSTATAGPCAANEWSGAAAAGSGPSSTWPALVGTKYNPILRVFYRRLRDAGKPAKVALTACMRKLLTILNAIAATNTPWKSPQPA
jgi:transposase